MARVSELSRGAGDAAIKDVQVVEVAEVQEPGGARADLGVEGGAACARVVKVGRLGANPSVEIPTNKGTLLGRELSDQLLNLGSGIELLDVLPHK